MNQLKINKWKYIHTDVIGDFINSRVVLSGLYVVMSSHCYVHSVMGSSRQMRYKVEVQVFWISY